MAKLVTRGRFSRLNRSCQRFVYWPFTDNYSTVQGAWVHPHSFCPLGDVLSLVVMFDWYIPSSVVHLFFLCGPPNITGLVVTVFVWVAVYRVSHRGSRTYVCYKVQKTLPIRLLPSSTDADTASPVISTCAGIRVSTAMEHRFPAFVAGFWSIPTAMYYSSTATGNYPSRLHVIYPLD